MPLTTIASLASTLAKWLQIRKQGREAGSQKTITDYKEWLRRQEHADLVSRLEENSALLAHVKQLIEDRSLDSIDSQQQAQQTIEQRLSSARVSIGHLPNTGPHLFGRDVLLSQIDDLWGDAKLNVVSIVAGGGVGKSALVNRWLDRLTADGWRGARRVYGHSFYSQGTRHETASADAFVNEALCWFGDEPPAEDRRSPWAKGERLAELVRAERTLLILDGMEPLQLPPGPNEGHINDPALQALMRELAADNPGLCVVTSRIKVADLERFPNTTRPIDLQTLSPEAGAELLHSLGVKGAEDELRHASEDFGNHALALTLLGTYLVKAHGGDVRKCSEIKLTEAAAAVSGAHTHNMMAWYEKWFKNNGRHAEVSILRMLGLFNRPAEKGCIDALRAEPAIAQLTDGVVGISEADWNLALSNLRAAGLVARPDEQDADGALDCHPLVREHFGEALRERHAEAWQAGHNRLYEYLKGPGCAKDLPDTLEEMQPLFAAATHGCAAGRHQEALEDVYRRRIQRGNEHFCGHQLGARGAELGALAGMFTEPWRQPAASLGDEYQAFVLNEAGFNLRALGRLAEAVAPTLAGLGAYVARNDWKNAAILAGNVSELLLTLGRIRQAVDYAKQSVEFADRSGDVFQRISKRVKLANALHQANHYSDAQARFQEAERIQKEPRPRWPLLFSTSTYPCCELLLARGDYQAVMERVSHEVKWAPLAGLPRLSLALYQLSLGRAYLLKARAEGGDTYKQASACLDTAVDKLREVGQQDELPHGLLARAELYIFTRDFDAARADLNEVLDIATRDPQGHMKLFVTDYHLLSARLELAQADVEVEAVKTSADRATAAEHGAKSAEHHATAGQHADQAAALTKGTGYHRRDKDLAELRARLT